MPPPLVRYVTAAEYRAHYERVYCRGRVFTFDGVRVHFSPSRFKHAFFESPRRDGAKDRFSPARAERIDWIKATLESPDAELFQGWDKSRRRHDGTYRVAVVYGDFVVVLAMSLTQDGALKGNFVTCYVADNSIERIRNAPRWTRDVCLDLLRQRRRGGAT